jgi:hypothetical protein
MTGSELIEKLIQYPSSAEVLVRNECGSWVGIEQLDYDEVTGGILLLQQQWEEKSYDQPNSYLY